MTFGHTKISDLAALRESIFSVVLEQHMYCNLTPLESKACREVRLFQYPFANTHYIVIFAAIPYVNVLF
jgi:hypothetical protein